MKKDDVDFDAFLSLDVRVGTVLGAEPLEDARQPAYILRLDMGEELGEMKSSAQITSLYQTQELIGRQILAVVNLGEKQIGKHRSQCLVLGVHTEDGVVLLSTERGVQNGLHVS